MTLFAVRLRSATGLTLWQRYAWATSRLLAKNITLTTLLNTHNDKRWPLDNSPFLPCGWKPIWGVLGDCRSVSFSFSSSWLSSLVLLDLLDGLLLLEVCVWPPDCFKRLSLDLLFWNHTWITLMFSPVSCASFSRIFLDGFGVAAKVERSASSCLALIVVLGPRRLLERAVSKSSSKP